jgi:selenocysteine lyase/cysteine desulfurase
MDQLFDAGFAALVMNWPQWPHQLLRVSAHLYNTPADYRALAGTLRT